MSRKASAPPARFVVGIDLGTTNCVVAYADTLAVPANDTPTVQVLPIPQLLQPGTVEPRSLLPSFLYLPAAGEDAGDVFRLPWPSKEPAVIGTYARARGAEVPGRLVASAKSWLCHGEVDRLGPILPWGASEDVPRLSPVEASARYLSHLRAAWDAAFPKDPLAQQEILLTVPASFDAVARDLTLRAAREAGLPEPTLLEEPQAAFYAWVNARGDEWRESVQVGDVILVCDIGGGTTDFTLIAVCDQEGTLGLERLAVGDHILLGGDNMDLALAYRLRENLATGGTQLDPWQLRGLTVACRDAKEALFADLTIDSHPVALLGRGRKLIGGTLRAEVRRDAVDAVLVQGFFPRCEANERPLTQRRTALQELGLPYAADASVTRHLAHFLQRNAAMPTAVLFNGGVMRAAPLRERLLAVMTGWFPGSPAPRVLEGADPEHSVARGAAYYGLARRGRGVRIRGGIPRSYYVGIESAMPAVPGMRPPLKALCIVPRGLEEGSNVGMPAEEFGLVVGEPSEFRFLTSAARAEDRVGSLVENWGEEITELAPLEATVEWKGHEGNIVPIRLEARVTELGVLELWCVSRDGKQRWRLEFNVRHAPATREG